MPGIAVTLAHDLVAGYCPNMREVDDGVIAAAGIFVGMCASAPAEAGGMLDPIARAIIAAEAALGDLADPARGASGKAAGELAVFNAAGTAAAGFAAAEIVWKAR